ncbi:MAG: DUF1329 domain-containing protein [Deltaproteobacteria bacterium]|nr:DUF1329 domain-containing protein [Deltaproteobacteria bacterium]
MTRNRKVLLVLALVMAWSITGQAAQKRALSVHDLSVLLAGGVYNARIVQLVRDRGINFLPTSKELNSLRHAGADLALLNAVESARHITAQQPQRISKPQPERVAPSASHKVRSIPQNTLTVPTTSVERKAVPATPAKVQQTTNSPVSGGIAPGSIITLGNWRQYAQYMPLGMTELFKGNQFWKMPPDLKIVVGPTVAEKLPAGYAEATAKYSSNVRVVHLGNGHNDVLNYSGGEPFPNPQQPDKGYKLLADLWFAYVPHFLAGTPRSPLTICSETSHLYSSCERLSYVYRQVAYNTDGEVSPEEAKTNNYWYTEWLTVEEPEELRYTTLLMLYPKDTQRDEDQFMFTPSLRRWIRGSLASRCSPVVGTDYIQDDFKRVGFNGGLGLFNAQFLEHRQILALTGDYLPMGGEFPLNYYMPLGWPRPSWGKWQLRDVDVIDVRRVPTEMAGYCYGKRLIYEDSQTHYALWEDAYDKRMRFWKTALIAQRVVKKPLLGEVTGAFSSTAWDFEFHHLTNASTQGKGGRDVLVDGEVPAELRNFTRYSTLAGLSQIMK